MKVALVLLLCSLAAGAQTSHNRTRQHVITKGDLVLVHDCHTIYLDADDEMRRQQAEEGSGRLPKPSHSTAYECYTTENPVYKTLVDLNVHDKLSEEGQKLLNLVRDDISYFQLSLDEDEK